MKMVFLLFVYRALEQFHIVSAENDKTNTTFIALLSVAAVGFMFFIALIVYLLWRWNNMSQRDTLSLIMENSDENWKRQELERLGVIPECKSQKGHRILNCQLYLDHPNKKKSSTDQQTKRKASSQQQTKRKSSSHPQIKKKSSSHQQIKGKTSSHQQIKGKTSSDQQTKGKTSSHQQTKGKSSSHQQMKGKTSSHQQMKGKSSSQQQMKGKPSSHQQTKGKSSSHQETITQYYHSVN